MSNEPPPLDRSLHQCAIAYKFPECGWSIGRVLRRAKQSEVDSRDEEMMFFRVAFEAEEQHTLGLSDSTFMVDCEFADELGRVPNGSWCVITDC